MTDAEDRYWREQGPDAIDAEMERRIVVWLAKKRRQAEDDKRRAVVVVHFAA